jgi:hypothetical protein
MVMLAAQAIPCRRTNPPASGEMPAAAEVRAVLRRACYDCHSNETRWPWYSAVAPASWLVAHDVGLGRKELNFSEWASYYRATRRRKLEWIARKLRERSMAPARYRAMHPEARLSNGERAMLERWVQCQLSQQDYRTLK